MSTLRNTGPALVRGRHIARVATALGSAAAIALTTLAAACADGPTAPAGPSAAPSAEPAPHMASTTGATTSAAVAVRTLLWNSPVTQATTSAVIGWGGGTLPLPGGGALVVPQGAVSSPTAFSATRLPGRIVAYDFEPHGRTFAAPLTVRVPGAGNNLAAVAGSGTATLQGAYFPSSNGFDQARGSAAVTEFAPSTTLAWDRSWVSFPVRHFSGYLMSTGRM
jgi:hypothetical protein